MIRANTCLPFLFVLASVLAEPAPPNQARIDQLLNQLNTSWDMGSQVRAQKAYKELMKMGRAIVPGCLRLVQTGNGSGRMWAAAALAATNDPRAVGPLLKLLNDKHPKVRMIASYHINRFLKKDPRVAPALGARISDPSPDVRQQASRVLTRWKSPAALPNIKKALKSPDRDIRVDALRLTLFYEGKQLKEEVPRIVQSSRDGNVRSAALSILPTLQKMNEVTALQIVGAITDKDARVSQTALELLTDFFKKPPLRGDSLENVVKGAAPAVALAIRRKEVEIRQAAMPLLGHLQREEAVPALAKALGTDPDPEVRRAAARGLAQTHIKDARVYSPLVGALKDKDPEVRSACLQLISALSGRQDFPRKSIMDLREEISPLAGKVLSDADPQVRAAAYVALPGLLPSRTVRVLEIAVTAEEDAKARKAAVIGLFLAHRPSAGIGTALAAAVGDPAPEVNEAAIKVIKKLLSGGEATTAMRRALTSKFAELLASARVAVRVRLLPLLASAGGKNALKTILDTVKNDPDASVRKKALEAVAIVRSRSIVAISTSVAALEDKDAAVRATAYKLFRFLTGQVLPFNSEAVPETRAEQVKAIRAWWVERQAAKP